MTTAVPTSPAERSLSQSSIASSYKNSQVQLLHCKSKVYVHRAIDGRDEQCGYLTLFEKNLGDRYIAWVPEIAIPLEELDTFIQVDTSLDDPLNVSMISISFLNNQEVAGSSPSIDKKRGDNESGMCCRLDAVRCIKVRPPSLSQWHGSMVVILRDGTTWPLLWFHDREGRNLVESTTPLSTEMDNTSQSEEQRGLLTNEAESTDNGIQWDGENVIRWISRLTLLVQAPSNPRLFIVDPTAEDELEFGLEEKEIIEEKKQLANGELRPVGIGGNHIVNTLKDIQWSTMERLSRVPHLAITAAERIMTLSPLQRFIPPAIWSQYQDNLVQDICDDYSPAAVYLAKWAADASKYRENVPGEAKASAKSRDKQREQVEMTAWRVEHTELGAFEVLNTITDMPLFTVRRLSSLTAQQWQEWMDNHGVLVIDESRIKSIIFSGGIEPEIRSVVWPFLLGIFPWKSSKVDRMDIKTKNSETYNELKQKWQTSEAKSMADYIEQSHRIEKDVLRTDRQLPIYADQRTSTRSNQFLEGNTNLIALHSILMTYNYYNVGHGYVQGMSDLISPLYEILRDESMAFWCFTAFMHRMERNFSEDQVGMRHQLIALKELIQFMKPRFYQHLERTDSLNLFFCFRWLLIWFKREMKFQDCKRLWEVLWTDHYSSEFPIFIALAILDQHDTVIMDHLKRFDEILKYVNDLSMTINLDETLCRAELLYLRFQRAVSVLDEQGGVLSSRHKQQQRSLDPLDPLDPSSISDEWVNASPTTVASLYPVTDELRSLLGQTFTGQLNQSNNC
ncbi:rab-GTPase-TBC domain-containing protein [Syncephalis fuscata]|nr:rab-GTPase-TBC domain-containing protein [Syncephalis fuscata]